MGKKQKKLESAGPKNIQAQNVTNQQIKVNKSAQSQQITKLSKKQRKKLRKLINKTNVEFGQQVSKQALLQKEAQQQTPIEEDSVQEIIKQNEDVISIESSEIDEIYGNQIQLNPRGKQGFEALLGEEHQKISNQVRSINIKTIINTQQSQTLYLYHAKKQTYYKATSLYHQKVNSTHLNETVSISIVEQNLLKNAYQQSSLLFLLNGKTIPKRIQFLKSTVFKVIKDQSYDLSIKNDTKNLKKTSKFQNAQNLKSNVEKFIKPSSSDQIEQIFDFLRDFDWKEDCLLVSKEELCLTETNPPFANIDEKSLASNNSLLILGKKNTGKSTLSQYLKNTNPNTVCILDCDIGRSLTVSGCVSLLTSQQSINLWIGEFTPFNCITSYLRAIQTLYQLYRQRYFSKKLIINTMGYLSGLGEMIIYEIYNLINPSEIIVLNSANEDKVGNMNLSNIIHHIRTGTYLKRLLTSTLSGQNQNELRKFNQKKISLYVQEIKNEHAQGKGIPIRFQNLLMYKKNIKNILELVQSIKQKKLHKIQNIALYQQDKLGNISTLNSLQRNHSDMRIVLLGKCFSGPTKNQSLEDKQAEPLFRVFGVGYGFEGSVYFSQQQIQKFMSPGTNVKEEIKSFSGVLSQSIDFQKNFYLVNQLSLIDHQLIYGEIPYLIPIIKGMGSKGTRNNPSKNA